MKRRRYLSALALAAAVSSSLILLAGGCGGTSATAGFDPAAGLIHYYPFSGNAQDSCPDAKNGTVDGGVVPTTDREGTADSAYLFDGSFAGSYGSLNEA